MSSCDRQPVLCVILAILALGLAAAFTSAAAAAVPGAFTAPDDPGVPGLIASLRGCLASLPAADQRALTLRAGLDGHAPRLSAEVAAVLKGSPGAASAAEVAGIRKLEAQHRRGACQVQAAAAPGRPRAAATGHRPSSSSAGATTGVLGILLPALLALAFIAGISREMLRNPRA